MVREEKRGERERRRQRKIKKRRKEEGIRVNEVFQIPILKFEILLC